jgi:hypothetical protein
MPVGKHRVCRIFQATRQPVHIIVITRSTLTTLYMYAIRECYKVSISKDIVIKAVLNFWVFSILNWLVVPGTGPFRCRGLATLQCRTCSVT